MIDDKTQKIFSLLFVHLNETSPKEPTFCLLHRFLGFEDDRILWLHHNRKCFDLKRYQV